MEIFYEGLPRGDAIPWEGWIVPLLAWSVFIAGLYAATLGITLLFHRHWSDHERLVYPLMRLPIEMARGVGGRQMLAACDKKHIWFNWRKKGCDFSSAGLTLMLQTPQYSQPQLYKNFSPVDSIILR